MKNLLEQAVLNREQKIVKEVFVNNEDEFYVDECDCDDAGFIDKVLDAIAAVEPIMIPDESYNDLGYLEDDLEICVFVESILQELDVDQETIETYLCETHFEDSFLVAEEFGDDFEISVHTGCLIEFYTTYLES